MSTTPPPPPTLFCSAHEMPQASLMETGDLMTALAKKYGEGTMLAGVQLCNLTNIVRGAYATNTTKLEGAELEKARRLCMQIVEDVILLLAPNIGACCLPHVRECAASIQEQVSHVGRQLTGENQYLDATEGEAKAALIRAAQPQ